MIKKKKKKEKIVVWKIVAFLVAQSLHRVVAKRYDVQSWRGIAAIAKSYKWINKLRIR